MQIHVNGTHRYASTQPFTIGTDGKRRYAHKHWGTLDENLRFHPNTTYLYASIEERSKLIFPKEWDLSELENLESKRGSDAYEAELEHAGFRNLRYVVKDDTEYVFDNQVPLWMFGFLY